MDNYTRNYQNPTELASSFSVLMRNVYTWMAVGLALTALTTYLVAGSESIIYAIASTPILM